MRRCSNRHLTMPTCSSENLPLIDRSVFSPPFFCFSYMDVDADDDTPIATTTTDSTPAATAIVSSSSDAKSDVEPSLFSGGADLRPHLVVCSNEQAHYARKNIDLSAILGAAVGVPAIVKPLECGDYAVVWARDADAVLSEDRTQSQCYILVERKTLPDFENSFLDRYKDQADRLAKSGVPYVFWVLTPGPLRDPNSLAKIETACDHLQISYRNTRVIRLGSGELTDFAAKLRTIIKYVHNTEFEGNSGTEVPSLVAAQRAGAKLKLDTQADVYIEQLAVPHGMSRRKAEAVAVKAPSMPALLALWRGRRDEARAAAAASAAASAAAPTKGKGRKRVLTVEEQVDAVLADVPLPGGTRLGPAMSKRLRETIVPDLNAL